MPLFRTQNEITTKLPNIHPYTVLSFYTLTSLLMPSGHASFSLVPLSISSASSLFPFFSQFTGEEFIKSRGKPGGIQEMYMDKMEENIEV